MLRFDPYYAQDTDGIHFQVNVDGHCVWAHVSSKVLDLRYGHVIDASTCLAAFLNNAREIEVAVSHRVRAFGPETVVLQVADLDQLPRRQSRP